MDEPPPTHLGVETLRREVSETDKQTIKLESKIEIEDCTYYSLTKVLIKKRQLDNEEEKKKSKSLSVTKRWTKRAYSFQAVPIGV